MNPWAFTAGGHQVAGGVGGYMYEHGPGDKYWTSNCGVYKIGEVGTITSETSGSAGVYRTGVPTIRDQYKKNPGF